MVRLFKNNIACLIAFNEAYNDVFESPMLAFQLLFDCKFK